MFIIHYSNDLQDLPLILIDLFVYIKNLRFHQFKFVKVNEE